jgi:hypothetical protein
MPLSQRPVGSRRLGVRVSRGTGTSGYAETAAIDAHKFVAALGENDLGFSVANQGYDGYRHWKIAIHTYAYYVVLLTLVPDRLENGCYPIGGGRGHKRKDVAVIRLCRDSGNQQQGNQRRRQKKSHHVPPLQKLAGTVISSPATSTIPPVRQGRRARYQRRGSIFHSLLAGLRSD